MSWMSWRCERSTQSHSHCTASCYNTTEDEPLLPQKLGYKWAYRVVDTRGFGLPHRRRRVFIVASLHGDPRDVLLSQIFRCEGTCARDHGAACYRCFAAGADVRALRPVPVAAFSSPPEESGVSAGRAGCGGDEPRQRAEWAGQGGAPDYDHLELGARARRRCNPLHRQHVDERICDAGLRY